MDKWRKARAKRLINTRRRAGYKAAKDWLEQIEVLERRELKKDYGDKDEIRRERHHEDRARQIPRSLRCPRCGRKQMDLSRWVVGRETVCASCHRVPEYDEDEYDLGEPFTMSHRMWRVRGVVNCTHDWSAAKRSRVNTGARLVTDAELDGVVVERKWLADVVYSVNASALRDSRLLLRVTPATMAEYLGWSITRWKSVEQGRTREVSVRVVAEVLAVLEHLTSLQQGT